MVYVCTHGVYVYTWCLCVHMVYIYIHGVFVYTWCMCVYMVYVCIHGIYVYTWYICVHIVYMCIHGIQPNSRSQAFAALIWLVTKLSSVLKLEKNLPPSHCHSG